MPRSQLHKIFCSIETTSVLLYNITLLRIKVRLTIEFIKQSAQQNMCNQTNTMNQSKRENMLPAPKAKESELLNRKAWLLRAAVNGDEPAKVSRVPNKILRTVLP